MDLNAVSINRPKNRDRVTIHLLLATQVVPSVGEGESFCIMTLFVHSYKASGVGFGVQIFSVSQLFIHYCAAVYSVDKLLK
jgi:hypothetical protein